MPSRPFPSFTLALSSDDTIDLPDYYRATYIEEYGSSAQPQVLTKSTDPHFNGFEFTASSLLVRLPHNLNISASASALSPRQQPVILEEHELDYNDSVDGVTPFTDRGVHAPSATTARKTQPFVFLWNFWRKCRLRRSISRHSDKHHNDKSNSEPAKARRGAPARV